MKTSQMRLLIILSNLEKPADVKFEDVQETPKGDYLLFTDLIKNGPSHGNTFTVPVENATTEGVALALEQMRARYQPEHEPIPGCTLR